MAPLSKEISGLILPYDTFGSHLDASNRTVDPELEVQNFAAAAEVLASVWSAMVIDDHPVVARYCHPGSEVTLVEEEVQQWLARHVCQSRYLIQIAKCDNEACCKARRTDYQGVLGGRFLPPPIPLAKTAQGPCVGQKGTFGSLFRNIHLARMAKITASICIELGKIEILII